MTFCPEGYGEPGPLAEDRFHEVALPIEEGSERRGAVTQLGTSRCKTWQGYWGGGWPAGPGVWLRGSVRGGSHSDPGFLAGTGPWGALAVHQETRRGWAWGIRPVREHAGSAGGLGKCVWGPTAQKWLKLWIWTVSLGGGHGIWDAEQH